MINSLGIKIFLCFLFCSSICVFGQNENLFNRTYTDSDTNKITNGFTRDLFSKLSDKRIFLIGETHWADGNDELEYNLFRDLFFASGFNILALELDISYVYFINKYIETGNESILTQIHNKDGIIFINRYKELRKFYLSLPSNRKFKVLGINNENGIHQSWAPIFCLYYLFQNHKIPDELRYIQILIDEMYRADKLPNINKLTDIGEKILADLNQNDELFKNCFNEDYFMVKRIIESIIIGYKNPTIKKNDKNFVKRESFLYDMICLIQEQFPNDKIFCITGRYHINKNDVDWLGIKKWKSYASMLNNNIGSPFRGSVLSGIIYYKNYQSFEKKVVNQNFLTRNQKKTINDLSNNDTFSIINVCEANHLFNSYCGVLDYIFINKFYQKPGFSK